MTPTQKRMAKLLADGKPHRREELHALLWDEQGPYTNIHMHLSNLRRQLRPGEAIVCEIVQRRICYRHVRLLG